MEDQKIITLFWDRDEGALAAVQEKYGSYCHQIARNILQDEEDCGECVNDTWLRAWNSIPPARPDNLRFFLARITRNLALDRYRAESAAKRGGGAAALALEELAECTAAGETTEQQYFAKELQETVNRFVRSLPEREGNIFIRRYFFLETAAQIAERYGITASHATVILSRTRKKLHTFLKKEGLL